MGKNGELRGMNMKKTKIISVALLIANFLFCGCSQALPAKEAKTQIAPKITREEKIKKFISQMTPEEKVGQMMIVGLPGSLYDETAQTVVGEYHVGGIIHFDRNLTSGEQIAALNKQLQGAAKETGHHIPLFIAVDQEGGQVVRMGDTLPNAPSAAALGETGQPAQAKDWAAKTALGIKKYGFNTNFAPVADLGFTNRRSYGSTAQEVTPFVLAAAEGYKENKVMCSLKHFPGIGRAAVDPHKDTSEITASQQELATTDLVPFLTVVNKMPQDNFMIMVSHLVYPAYEKVPASVSRMLLTNLLRKEWQYKGIIITDDMAMGGLANVYAPEEAGVLAIEAGADILLSCGPGMTPAIYTSVLQAVKNGDIPRQRIDESVYRILSAKEVLGIWQLDEADGIK